MLYIPDKFPYKELSRQNIDNQRKYLTPTGEKLASVTTILDATKSEESKQALNEWRKRVGFAKAQEITTEAAGRGTRMHKFLEDFIKTNVLNQPGSNPYSIQSHKMSKEIIDKGLSKCQEFWGTEVSLYFPKLYAGTTDLVGVHENKESILDFKQTNKPKRREWIEGYFVQLVAYALAHNEVYNTNIRKGVILMCSAEFEYQEFVIEGSEFDHYEALWWQKLEQFYSM